jgi:hypothetical protein
VSDHQRAEAGEQQQLEAKGKILALIQALVKALPVLFRGESEGRDRVLVKGDHDAADVHAAAATCLSKSVGKVSDEEVRDFVRRGEEAAASTADFVGEFFVNYAAHLASIGCPPESVLDYVRLEQQTLGSLYYLAREAAPSPTELRRLAFRLALDARKPVEGNVNRITCQPGPRGWVVAEHTSLALTAFPLQPAVGGRRVWNPITRVILDCILNEPPSIFKLMEIIEVVFGGPPQRSDTLEGVTSPSFTYAVAGEREGPVVRLSIDGREVPLRGRADVHRLLKELCLNPGARRKGRQLERERGITNASQAAKQVQQALDSTHPGAGAWLRTEPYLHWADGHVPHPSPATGKG